MNSLAIIATCLLIGQSLVAVQSFAPNRLYGSSSKVNTNAALNAWDPCHTVNIFSAPAETKKEPKAVAAKKSPAKSKKVEVEGGTDVAEPKAAAVKKSPAKPRAKKAVVKEEKSDSGKDVAESSEETKAVEAVAVAVPKKAPASKRAAALKKPVNKAVNAETKKVGTFVGRRGSTAETNVLSSDLN